MSSLLSTLVDNLSAWLHDKKCKKCKSCYEYTSTEDKKLICKCIDCNRNYELRFNIDLINRFADTYKFCNKAINKFILLLKKVIYLYEYMDSWKRFDEESLPNKEDFYSSLNMEDITNVDCKDAKKYIWRI